MRRATCRALFLFVLCGWTAAGWGAAPTKPHWRHPVAAVLSADEAFLYTANERSGSVSVVDLSQKKTVAEFAVGRKLSDLQRTADAKRLVAVDELAHQLLLIDIDGSEVKVAQRLPVAQYPVDVKVSADGRRAYVASLWSRRLSVIDLSVDRDGKARVARLIDMPFAPRRQLVVDGKQRLIVADSHGGRLAIVDTQQGKLLFTRQFPGHNIRGLGVSANGKMLLASHQMLNELAHTVRNDVHWGLLMSNDLRWLRLDSVLELKSDLYEGAHMHPLGEANSATGDPAKLAVSPKGVVVVTLSGVGEVAIGQERDFSLYRIKVGRRPTAAVIDKVGKRALIANTFDDSISIVDLQKRDKIGDISLGPTTKLTQVERGERLFFDASLSHDSWMSCQSCHTGGHTNGMLNDNFSDASFGAPKRVLSLLGKSDTAPFAWNASAKSLKEQIRKSILNTMQGDQEPSDKQIDALAAFVQTLAAPPPIDKARGQFDEAAVARGRKVFDRHDCARCHAPPTYTTPKTYDVGLRDKQGNQKFNPPSLRGVGQRGAFFHDNRAATLEDVFGSFGHQLKSDLKPAELADLLAFLRSL